MNQDSSLGMHGPSLTTLSATTDVSRQRGNKRSSGLQPRRLSTNSSDPTRSHQGTGHIKSTVNYENTYRLAPDSDKELKFLRVRDCIQKLLHKNLNNEKYDAKQCPRLCKKLSDTITQEIKLLPNSRHKIVTIVFIGENKGQDLRVASRCLWDSRYDNCISVEYKNQSMFVVANVYGLYYE
jgi:tctex1 domain-containing protein 2